MYMIYIMIYIPLIVFISLLLFLFNNLISMILPKKTNKNTSYECGFDPISKASIPFSLPFFMISLLFLIFDIEIVILLPMILFLNYLNLSSIYIIFFFFTLLLILSIIIEYSLGFLNWIY